MRQQMNALKAYIGLFLILGKAAVMQVKKQNGKFAELSNRGLITLANAATTVVQAAAATLTADDSGTTYSLSLAGGFTLTLPAPEAGMRFKFVVGVAPTTAYIIVTNGSANIIHGQVCTSEDAAGDVACAAASDTITFVATAAIIGDWVELESDGTNWYIKGMCDVQDAITTTQAS